MNGAQDMGGQAGFGPIAPETDAPVFHAGWERRVLAMNLTAAALGAWPIDETRHARESLAPGDYLASSYYEIWAKALERLLVRHGFVTEGELASGRSLEPGAVPKRVLRPGEVARGHRQWGALRARSGGPSARLRRRRPGADGGDASARAYPAAALCAGQARAGGGGAGVSRPARQQRPRARRGA